jgi:hypothetical protein
MVGLVNKNEATDSEKTRVHLGNGIITGVSESSPQSYRARREKCR